MTQTQLQISEKEIENNILTWLKHRGVFAWKNQSVGVFNPRRNVFMKSHNPHHINGVADILGVIDGKILAIEVKKPTYLKRSGWKKRSQGDLEKMASDDQVLFINNVQSLGGIAFYADSLEIVKEYLKDII